MRIRTIKPGFWNNEQLAEIEPLGRLLFIGLWSIADKAGRLEDRPTRIKHDVLGYDDCDVEKLLSALQERGFIVRYQVAGARYIAIPTWERHQRPNLREPESEIPCPDRADSIVSTTTHVHARAKSCTHDHGDHASIPMIQRSIPVPDLDRDPEPDLDLSAIGSDHSQDPFPKRLSDPDPNDRGDTNSKPSRRKPETPWPDGFALTPEMREYALARGIDADGEFDAWRNDCIAKDRRYRDWPHAWRTRIDNAPKFGGGARPPGQLPDARAPAAVHRLSRGMQELSLQYAEALEREGNRDDKAAGAGQGTLAGPGGRQGDNSGVA